MMQMHNSFTPIRVLTVDDHPLLRDGIAAMLATTPDLILVGEAESGERAVELHRLLRPDVVLMDMQMPGMGGLAAMTAIRAEFPEARLVVLTTFSGDVLARRSLNAGAQAYLLKHSAPMELFTAIRTVYAGRLLLCKEVSLELAHHAGFDELSAREVEVLEAIAEGGSNKLAGRTLDITEGTVKSHVKSILTKLRAKDRTHAVTLALKRGVIGV